MADQLDKGEWGEMSDAGFAAFMARPGAPAYAPGYRANYARAAEWMGMVSRALERAAGTPDSASVIARAVRDSLPDSGRPLGAFMARMIDRVLDRETLIAAGRDEYAFWLEYDRAAAAVGPDAPRLSARAMTVIHRLVSQYR
jgi:hypothetical protein